MSDDHVPGEGAPEEIKAPFSFKLMIALTVIYLGWRLVQGIIWLVDRLS
ncbi:MAG TPA: hypothetical protein VK990_05855 [Acidimicrobiia bacterium]|nr:hypothetical protein [Acidimicrobiia bacterium]